MTHARSVGAAASVPPQHHYRDFHTYKNRLPHWRNQGATYFITWRLTPTQPDLAPNERDLLVRVLNHFEGTRYQLFSYVVMNDHIHSLVEPAPDWALEGIVHSWKSFSANQLQRQYGRQGWVWQKDYFDRIVKSEGEFQGYCDYILSNPMKRWPTAENYRWMGFGGTEAASPTVSVIIE